MKVQQSFNIRPLLFHTPLLNLRRWNASEPQFDFYVLGIRRLRNVEVTSLKNPRSRILARNMIVLVGE